MLADPTILIPALAAIDHAVVEVSTTLAADAAVRASATSLVVLAGVAAVAARARATRALVLSRPDRVGLPLAAPTDTLCELHIGLASAKAGR